MNAHNELQKSTYYTLDAHGKRKHRFRRPSGSAGPISVYERVVDTTQQSLTFEQAEKHIYGSSRLGVMNVKVPLLGTQNNTYNQNHWSHVIGERTYEISNHLGNVLSVISDKPIPVDNGGMVDYYAADIRNAQDYSPFGVTLRERSFSLNGAGDYRYQFNGMEIDNEIKGKGNSYTTEFRQYDPRLGRWLSLDPLFQNFPWQSPYAAFDNNPIVHNDPRGLAAESAAGGGDKVNRLTNKKGNLESKRDDNNFSGLRKGFINTRIRNLEKRINKMNNLYPNENGSGSMVARVKADVDGKQGTEAGEYNVPDGKIIEKEVSASPVLNQFGYRVPVVRDGKIVILDIGRPEEITDEKGTYYRPIWNANSLGQKEGSPVRMDNGKILGESGEVLFSLPRGVSENDGFFHPGEIISTVDSHGKKSILNLADKTTIQRTFLKKFYDGGNRYIEDRGIRPKDITQGVLEQNL